MNDAIRAALGRKSRTINANAIAAPLFVVIVWLAGVCGVQMPPEVAAAFVALIMAALNVGLRFVTSLPLADKARKE